MHMLLDSGSDAHIIPERSCFVSTTEPDVRYVKVGKEGQYLHFEAMGPCLVGVLLEATESQPQRVACLLLDKCYLPRSGDGNTFIMSTGRAWSTQGLIAWEAGVDELCVGSQFVKFSRRNFSPVMKILIPEKCPELNISLSLGGCFGHHLTGAPKASKSPGKATYRLRHLRMLHGDHGWMERLYQQPMPHPPCHHCRLMKTKAPASPPATGNHSTKPGDLAHMDIWQYQEYPATSTGWTHIMGIVDDHMNLMHAEGMLQPNGKRAANFVRDMYRIWKMVYKCKLRRIRFDNDTVFDCDEVISVMAELEIGREFSIPYMHFQLRIERHWQTMKNDGKTILAFVRDIGRTKHLYIHACLHSVMVRRECFVAPGEKTSQYTKATGIVIDPDKFRIFGCNMYAIMMPEQRKAYKFDKADPTTVYGIYIGNAVETKGWLCAAPGKIVLAGAAIIDEVSAIQQATTAAGDDLRPLIPEAWDDSTVHDPDGRPIGNTPSADRCQQVDKAPAAASDCAPPPPAPPARTPRAVRPVQRLDPTPTAPQRAKTPMPKSAASRTAVLVPATLWPTYPCTEHEGKGWTAHIVSKSKDRITVRFPHAKNHMGQPFKDVHLQPGHVVPLDTDGNPIWAQQDAALDKATDAAATLHALRQHEFTISPDPPHMELSSHMASHAAGTGADDATVIGDYQLMRQAVELAPEPREAMQLLAAQAARQTKIAMVLVTLASGTVWMGKPNTVEQAKALPNWQRWEMQMDAFIDKTRSVDGLYPVDKETTSGSKLANLKWVFTYKPVGDDPGERARLVWAHSPKCDGAFTEITFSNVVRPLHWKTLLHLAFSEGATACRRDISNAHQSIRVGPDREPIFSYPIPGGKIYDAQGRPAYIQWLNYLNGMPPAAIEFTRELLHHTKQIGLRQCVTDDLVLVWISATDPQKYLYVAINVDDMLCVYKGGEPVIAFFDAHLEKRWKVTKAHLDGWLGNNYYINAAENTVTIAMDVRIAEYMKEHLSDEMDSKRLPESPCHPRIHDIELDEDGVCPPETARKCARLNAQLMYAVVQCYFWAQYPVFYVARFGSKPSELGYQCLLHALRSLYKGRHIGLTLGGRNNRMVASASLVTMAGEPTTLSEAQPQPSDPTFQPKPGDQNVATAHCDAGHAEAGPSTGGHTMEIDGTTIHAVSGQHHAVTIDVTSAETMELSKCVASNIAYRMYLSEIGWPQLVASAIHCDNMGSVLKAASGNSDKRALYMKRRVQYIQNNQDTGESRVEHVPTDLNRADILTKPMTGQQFLRMRDMMMNTRAAATNIHAWTRRKLHQRLGSWWSRWC